MKRVGHPKRTKAKRGTPKPDRIYFDFGGGPGGRHPHLCRRNPDGTTTHEYLQVQSGVDALHRLQQLYRGHRIKRSSDKFVVLPKE